MLSSQRARRLIAWTIVGIAVGVAGCTIVPPALSAQTTTGEPRLIRVPTASAVPSGSADWRYDAVRDPGIFPSADRQRNLTLSLGFLPRVTLTARGTVAKDSVTGLDVARDLSAGAQLQVFQPRAWHPALAIGVQDVGGAASNFRSSYAVLSSTIGRLRATVGYGAGPDVLDGAFGGGELNVGRAVTVFGEYDADAFNAGVRLTPFPARWAERGIPRPTFDLLWQRGRSATFAVGVRTYLGALDMTHGRSGRAAPHYGRAVAGLSLQTVAQRLQRELVGRGLENVRVTIARLPAGLTVVAEYENRTYNRSELDALGMVLGLAALRTPASVTQLRAVVKKLNIPVIQLTVSAASFLAFVNEQEAPDAFAQELAVSQAVSPVDATQREASTANTARSWLKADVFLRPRVETTVLTEWGVVDARFSALPDVQMQLTPGTSVAVRAAIPFARTRNYPGQLGDPAIDRALLQQAVRLPGGTSRRSVALTQLSVGRYDAQHVGAGDELALMLAGGEVLAKGTVARVGPSYDNLDRWVALANARVRYPAWDFTLSVTAGQFLDGDRGFTADAGRFFGNTETAMFFRHSDRGSLAGIRFAIPLTVTRELSPWRIRPRLPDVYSYEHRTTVLGDRNEIRSDIGRVPSTDHEIERIYWDRDRLNEVYIRRHVESLRRAARDLIADGS